MIRLLYFDFLYVSRLISISSMSTATMVYLTVGTSLAGLLFTCMAFFSLTAMLLALDNFWDAALLTTGEVNISKSSTVYQFYSTFSMVIMKKVSKLKDVYVFQENFF